MVVFQVDVHGLFARPSKSDPIIPAHPYRPTLRFAAQTVKVKADDIEIFGLKCYVQQLNDSHALPDHVGTDPAGPAVPVKLFKRFVFEAADHSLTVNCLVYSVKPLIAAASP